MADDYFDLGQHSWPVSTSSEQAQLWFDRGLLWSYAFNHEEAVRCFEQALEYDPGCAMAYWGIAYAIGPNYNKAWDQFDPVELAETAERAYAVTTQAVGHRDGATPVEQALIQSLRARYPSPTPPKDFADWTTGYADAMRQVYGRFSDDLDVTTLFADALMNITPWQLWDQVSGEPAAGAATVEAKTALERALETPGAQRHPGVLHVYIHLMEMSPFPERALPAADSLRGLVPDGGHLRHMPTHIDVLCGDYRRVVSSNAEAIEADLKYLDRAGAMNFYTLYRAHDYHFKIYGAMFLGQAEVALRTADELAQALPEDLLRVEVPPMADWAEGFVPMKLHALIRFGRWQEIIDLPLPTDQKLYCVTTAMTHYAKGIALAATGRVAEAEAERQRFAEAVALVPDTRYVFNNTCLDILAVAAVMLDGEIEYRKGNHDEAFALLREAISRDDNLPYDEPWGWMQPTRHAYGALLLEQGRVEEAEAVYLADLGLDDTLARANQHPNNVWSLHGYHECLTRLGKPEQARLVKQLLDIATVHTDVPITASCACRMSA
jgi:tetratricopeptide (TPR) repeat protein